MDGREPDDPQDTEDTDNVVDVSTMPEPADGTVVAPSRNIFAPICAVDQQAERAARKRAALWGFGTGLVMLVIVGLCLVLAILLSNSAN